MPGRSVAARAAEIHDLDQANPVPRTAPAISCRSLMRIKRIV
jgi:hypothetical protein